MTDGGDKTSQSWGPWEEKEKIQRWRKSRTQLKRQMKQITYRETETWLTGTQTDRHDEDKEIT